MVFETVSFHIVKPCNMKCKFCYATFEDMGNVKQMSEHEAFICIDKLHRGGVKKITFAGGEPLLYRHIKSVIRYAKSLGITTSIITNGSLLNSGWLIEMRPFLDWIGVSIDSLSAVTMANIGRVAKGNTDYFEMISEIKQLGYKLKINTVVNSYNWQEDFNSFIKWATPDRWKVFQALRVEGQNDTQFDEIKVSDSQFTRFLDTHIHQPAIVPENNSAMTGSYLLIDPTGRLFENSNGSHTYSDSLIDYDIQHCLKQIKLDRGMFIERGGIYQW